jgi:hypothetical protein
MSVHVFVGPTIPVEEARRVLDAEYLPPAAMGDVLRLLARRPRVIAIVDGVFEREPAVWHKEILFALSEGVHVLGAASMGALRAAELHAFGMVGVGRVFEAYRDGLLEDDDEVAVAHARAAGGHRAASDAMVNIREGARVAREAGVVSPRLAEAIVASQKARFYPDRSWRDVLAGRGLDADRAQLDALGALLPAAPNLKRSDALALLETIRDRFAAPDLPPHAPSFDFEATTDFHRAVLAEAGLPDAPGGAPVACGDVGRHVRLTRPDGRALLRAGLFRFLVARAAAQHGLADRPLAGDVALVASAPALAARLDQLADALADAAGFQLDAYVCAELSARGELTETAAAVRAKWATLGARGLDRPDLSDTGLDEQQLSDWFERRFGALASPGADHAHALGFGSWEELIREVVAEHLVERDRGA